MKALPERNAQYFSAERIAADCIAELGRALKKFPAFHSAHEGYAVILEELDELWEEIKLQQPDTVNVRREAIQVAAMAMRFVMDICESNARNDKLLT